MKRKSYRFRRPRIQGKNMDFIFASVSKARRSIDPGVSWPDLKMCYKECFCNGKQQIMIEQESRMRAREWLHHYKLGQVVGHRWQSWILMGTKSWRPFIKKKVENYILGFNSAYQVFIAWSKSCRKCCACLQIVCLSVKWTCSISLSYGQISYRHTWWIIDRIIPWRFMQGRI